MFAIIKTSSLLFINFYLAHPAPICGLDIGLAIKIIAIYTMRMENTIY